MVAHTPAWGLAYPDDYGQPADSPNALEELAVDTDAALTTLQGLTRGEFEHAHTQTVDWNTAKTPGSYYSYPGAANEPSTGLGSAHWIGLVVVFDVNFVEQVAWPHVPYPPVMMNRRCVGGAWAAWSRVTNYDHSWATLDNFTTLQHGGVNRFAHGMAKGGGVAAPHSLDEWRVQCYDGAGNFTWSAIKIPENGIVSMPKGHALALEKLDAGQTLDPEQVVTVGMVARLLIAILEGAGSADPSALRALIQETE